MEKILAFVDLLGFSKMVETDYTKASLFRTIGEELGWRGFLLPTLQTRLSAIASALIIGLIWFCWHIPLFWAPRYLGQR